MKKLSLWMVLTVGALTMACGSPTRDTGTLHLDFSDILEQAQTYALPIDQLEVTVTDREGSQALDVSPDALAFTVEVEPGEVFIEAVGKRTDLAVPMPTYFGDRKFMIGPLDDVEGTITMYPAGTLQITVTISADFELPEEIRVKFVALTPREQQSEYYLAPLVVGRLERILPTGNYDFFAEASFDGVDFDPFGPTLTTSVTHGETTLEALQF